MPQLPGPQVRLRLGVHAFAPVLLLTLAVLSAGLVLRGKAKEGLCAAVQWLEARARLSEMLALGLMIYWLVRLVLDAPHWRMVVS